MPYSNKYSGNRYGFRSYGRKRASRSFGRRSFGAFRGRSTLTRQVRALQAHARRVGNPERKWVDLLTQDTFAPGPAILPVNNDIIDIASNFATSAGASGVGQPGAILGNKVKIESIQLQGEFHIALGTVAVGGNSFRVVLYEDTDPNGTLAAPADIFYLNTALANPAVTTYSLRNMSTSSRFLVLWDHKFVLTSEGVMNHTFSKYMKIGRTIQFAVNGTGNVVAGTTGTNRTFGVLVISDGYSAANTSQYSVSARIRYTDN